MAGVMLTAISPEPRTVPDTQQVEFWRWAERMALGDFHECQRKGSRVHVGRGHGGTTLSGVSEKLG